MSRKEPASVTSAKITRTGAIIVAIITLIGVLIAAYWEFILKPDAQNQSGETKYIGRVIDADTLQPIAGAKITLDLEGVPPIVYTDSEGVYRFKVIIHSELSGQVRVDAQGYKTYTRNITIFPYQEDIEDIRLFPLGTANTPTETLLPSPTANPTLIAMFAAASTPDPKFIPQFRIVDGVEQSWIPESHFVAGDISGVGYADEIPIHLVYIDGFWIDRNLVTNSEYANCPDSICGAPKRLNSHARPNGYYNVPAYAHYPVMVTIQP